MERTEKSVRQLPSFRAGIAAALFLVFGMLFSASASAAFEQTGIFSGSLTPPAEPGVFPEEVQLGGVSGMAVNIDGAGGVPAGTVYTASYTNQRELRISRFTPSKEGLEFSSAWEVRSKEGDYERCGPLVAKEEEEEGKVPAHPHCPTMAEGGGERVDVDVDQSTGNVYAFNGTILNPESSLVVVFSPGGSKVISRFGRRVSGGESTAASPEKVHDVTSPGALAVDGSGTVYLFDYNYFDNSYHRLMVFKPVVPGDYTNYTYVPGGDLATGFLFEGEFPQAPVTDSAGNIFVAGDAYIEQYDPTHPTDPPVCAFAYAKGGITRMTVNPDTGEVFFYTYKDKRVHRLNPCAGGKFTEAESFAVSPERDYLYGMAFDPARQLDPGRAPGVLYGGAPSPVPGVGKGEPGQSALGYIFAPVKELAPVVESESVSSVTATTATLEAQINPKGSVTRYVFQYLSQAAYEANEPADRFAGASEAPLGTATLSGNGQEPIRATIALSGLTPDTSYHYRAIATSNCASSEPLKVCQGTGADQTFHSFAAEAPVLPDHRAWELVSPPQKNGGQVFPIEPYAASGDCVALECKPGAAAQHFPIQSAPDGESIVYEGLPFSPTEGAVIENQYIAHRDPDAGWQTTNLTPPLLRSKENRGYKAFNAELTAGLLEQLSPSLSPGAPSEYPNLYTQPTAAPLALTPLLISPPPNRLPGKGFGALELSYAGASTDFSRQFFAANDALTAATPVAPAAVDGGEEKKSLYEWVGGQMHLVNVLPGNTETIPGAEFGLASAHSISPDGNRVFWSDEAGQAYVRENGEVTTAIPDAGEFLSASVDGSHVLLSNGHVYDLESEATIDLTEGKGGFEGVAGHSEDLSHVYFVDSAVLDEEENDRGEKAQAGKHNLYAWDAGAGTTTFIATLLTTDNEDKEGDWASNPVRRSAEASPAGRWLAFTSKARLIGNDNTGPCEINDRTRELFDGPCREVFLYDSATGDLACPSCNPSGALPLGKSTLLRIRKAVPGSIPQPRYLLDSGRLYFDSGDSLVPTDTNGGVEDVYQYEPEGIGSCNRAGGCVSLLSAGHEAVDSNLLGIDATGKNVFFTSRDQLLLKDQDQLVDLYVAREGGGIASESEVARGECQGEACQPPFSPPSDPTPASSSFNGPGNIGEGGAKKCKKGQVRRSGKCVRKKHRAKHDKKHHHNRGGKK